MLQASDISINTIFPKQMPSPNSYVLYDWPDMKSFCAETSMHTLKITSVLLGMSLNSTKKFLTSVHGLLDVNPLALTPEGIRTAKN